YPEPLFDGGLRVLLFNLIPAGFIAYLPARFVSEPSAAGACAILAPAVGYALFASWFFRRGLRRYASGSRFGVFGCAADARPGERRRARQQLRERRRLARGEAQAHVVGDPDAVLVAELGLERGPHLLQVS